MLDLKLAGGDQNLTHGSIDRVAVDVDAWIHVRAQRLDLADGVDERTAVPESDVVECGTVFGEVDLGFLVGGKLGFLRVTFDSVSGPCSGDVAFNIRAFQRDLIRLDIEARDQRRNYPFRQKSHQDQRATDGVTPSQHQRGHHKKRSDR